MLHHQASAELANKFASNEHEDLILNITVYLLIAFVMIDGLFLDSARIYGNEGKFTIPSCFKNTTQSEMTIHFDNAGQLNYQF